MLNKIRNDVAHNKLVRVFLIVITLAFVFWGMGLSGLSFNKNYAIKVDSAEVSSSEYYRAYQQYKQQLTAQFQGQEISAELLKLLGVEKQVTDRFVNQALLEAYANDNNIFVGEETIFNLLKTQPGFFNEEGVFDKQVYKARLKEAQMNPLEFEKIIAKNIQANLVSNYFTNAVQVSDLELAMQVKHEQERRDIEVLTVKALDLAALPKATEEELNKLYQENIENFKVAEERSFKLLTVSKEALAKEQTATAQEVKAYFEEHQEEFFTKPEFKVQQILVKDEAKANEILAIADLNENFNKYVQEYSTDKSSKAKNGDMGWLTADIFGAGFENTVNATEKGKVATSTVKTVFGFHIFKITDIKEAKAKQFATVQAQIKANLISDKAEKELNNKIDATLDLVSAGENLDEISKQLGFKLQEFNNAKATNPQSYINEVFATELGEVSQQFDLGLNSFGFVEVTNINEESVKELADVKDVLIAKFNAAKTAEMLQVKADEVLTAITENKLSFKQAAKNFKLSAPVQSVVSLARVNNQKKQISNEIANEVFIAKPNTLVEKTLSNSNDIIIIKVLDTYQESIDEKGEERIRKALKAQKEETAFMAFMDSLKATYKVEVNQKVIDYILAQN